jgi:hypothetical protein
LSRHTVQNGRSHHIPARAALLPCSQAWTEFNGDKARWLVVPVQVARGKTAALLRALVAPEISLAPSQPGMNGTNLALARPDQPAS